MHWIIIIIFEILAVMIGIGIGTIFFLIYIFRDKHRIHFDSTLRCDDCDKILMKTDMALMYDSFSKFNGKYICENCISKKINPDSFVGSKDLWLEEGEENGNRIDN